MSWITCDRCGQMFDSDFDPDAFQEDGDSVICSSCREEIETRMLAECEE